MDAPLFSVETVDAPSWFAVVVIRQPRRGEPEIRCIGFKRREDRDRWLDWFGVSAAQLAGALPAHI